jgi:hypothetical protein
MVRWFTFNILKNPHHTLFKISGVIIIITIISYAFDQVYS